MPISAEEKDGYVQIKIDGELTVYEAAEFRDALLESIISADTLQIDLSGVSECDTAGIQILCSARVTADAEKKTLVLTGISEPVRHALETGGLNAERIFHREEEV